MDSDTDVDDEDDGAPAAKTPGANATKSPGEVLVAEQTDSNAGMGGGDDDEPNRVVTKAVHASGQSENTQLADFHLESDTDVDEEEEDDSNTKCPSTKIEARQVENASATPLNFDSDTDNKVLCAGANNTNASEASTQMTPAHAADAAAQLEILSDSDTDAEDAPPIPPFVATTTNAGLMSSTRSSGPISLSEALGPDSDSDTDVDEAVLVEVSMDPEDFRMGSDTDVEDKEEEAGAEGTVGGQESSSASEMEFASPKLHRALLQQSSTPAQLSGRM